MTRLPGAGGAASAAADHHDRRQACRRAVRAITPAAAAARRRRRPPPGAGALDQVGHDAMAVAVARRQLEHLADLERLREVEHDPRHAGAEAAEPQPVDQADRARAVDPRHLPGDLRQVDREPRRLVEREMAEADPAVEVDHHPGAVAVSGDPDVPHRGRLRPRARARGQAATSAAERRRATPQPATPGPCARRRARSGSVGRDPQCTCRLLVPSLTCSGGLDNRIVWCSAESL